MIILTLLFIACFSISGRASNVSYDIEQVDYLFSLPKSTVDYNEVEELCQRVITSNKLYDVNILAKSYVLLANGAIRKGDVNKAFEYAQTGLSLKNVDNKLTLYLLLKLAEGYYVKGQYQSVINVSQDIVLLANLSNNIQYQMISFAYKAMAHALLAEHSVAFEYLKKSLELMRKHDQFSDHIELLEIVAIAHYYLGDYPAAVEIYEQILTLQKDLSQFYNIEKNYYNLARSYQALDRIYDAYYAFSEAKEYAEKNSANIWLGYVSLGLGELLYYQEAYDKAFIELENAEKLFKQHYFTAPYLSTLIALAKVALKTKRQPLAYELLSQAQIVSQKVMTSNTQIELYLLLSEMYANNKHYEQAYQMLSKYQSLYEHHSIYEFKSSLAGSHENNMSQQNREIVREMSGNSELRRDFSHKFSRQKQIVNFLLLGVLCLLFITGYLLYKQRTLRLRQALDELQQPLDHLETPIKTKYLYQYHYKMARKYDYSLAVAYLVVTNWKELSFHFDKKVVSEVAQSIALLINENMGEFDAAGVLSEGEYLLLCPHQSQEEIAQKLDNLNEALKVRFFANLGEFSVKINFSYNAPSVQDIDPYIFLSRLSEATHQDL